MEMEFIVQPTIKRERNSKTKAKNEIFEEIGGHRIIGKHEIEGEFKTKDETEEDLQVKVEPTYEVTFYEDDDSQRFKCAYCNIFFYTNGDLIIHVFENHNVEMKENFQIKVEPKYEVTFYEDNCAQRFKCTICNTLFYTNDHLIAHVYKNHNFLDNILFNFMKCSLCGEDFSQFRVEAAKILLVEHVKNHH